MKNLLRIPYFFICLFFISTTTFADIQFSGFASINAGKVLSGTGVPHYDVEPTFLADYPLVSAYGEEVDFKPETLMGIQIKSDLTEGLSVTAQIVARGANDFDATFEWLYASYEVNDSWTIQAGKKRLPLFYYSDFFDVGYAYVWMRPPADNYTWQIFNYTGVNALYTGEVGDWSISGNIYGGEEDDPNNKLLGDFFFFETTREVWTNIIGGVFQMSKDWFELRVTHMMFDNERFRSGERVLFSGKMQQESKFYGVAANFDFGELFILTEVNRLDTEDVFDTRMISAGYRMDTITPFIAYSEFETDDVVDGENHDTTSIGLRWDFHDSAAFKIQYDKVKDNSFELAVAGDSKSLTIGIDVVF